LIGLAEALVASRQRAGSDRQVQGTLDEVEERALDRVCALAAVHPASEFQSLGVELMPR
jgi:hypothetical protein